MECVKGDPNQKGKLVLAIFGTCILNNYHVSLLLAVNGSMEVICRYDVCKDFDAWNAYFGLREAPRQA